MVDRRTRNDTTDSYRGGKSWNVIADEFCGIVLKTMNREGKDVITLPIGKMKEMVGDPDNITLRKRCRVHGVKIKRNTRTNAYTVTRFDVAKKEMKKRGLKVP